MFSGTSPLNMNFNHASLSRPDFGRWCRDWCWFRQPNTAHLRFKAGAMFTPSRQKRSGRFVPWVRRVIQRSHRNRLFPDCFTNSKDSEHIRRSHYYRRAVLLTDRDGRGMWGVKSVLTAHVTSALVLFGSLNVNDDKGSGGNTGLKHRSPLLFEVHSTRVIITHYMAENIHKIHLKGSSWLHPDALSIKERILCSALYMSAYGHVISVVMKANKLNKKKTWIAVSVPL